MSIPWALAVPVIVFLVIVMPIWLLLHYRTQWARIERDDVGEGQVAVDKTELERLRVVAGRLGERLDALERVLDAEHPNWRRS